MKFSQLNALVKSVQQVITCPKCQKHFALEKIEVININNLRGVFSAHCEKCNSTTLVSMSTRDLAQQIAARHNQSEKVLTKKISPEDVVEVKRFLENFNGDLAAVILGNEELKK